MVEEMGFWASFLAGMEKIPFCGTGTKNQGKGRVDFGRWGIIKLSMRLWELDGGKQYSEDQGSWRCPSSLDLEYTHPTACLAPSPTPALQGLSSVNVPCSPELLISCVQARISPSPSFPFPSPKENRTSNSLPLATYTHPALSSPRFLASADSLNSEEGGERRSDASPYIPAHVSGNCSQTPLPSILSTSTHNPSRPLVPSQSKTRAP